MSFLAHWRLIRCAVAGRTMIAIVARPVLAGTYLHCSTTRVVIVSAPTGDTSARSEDSLSFVIDDAAKTITFVNEDLAATGSTRIGSVQIGMIFFTN